MKTEPKEHGELLKKYKGGSNAKSSFVNVPTGHKDPCNNI